MTRLSILGVGPSSATKVRGKAVDEIDIAVGKAVRFFRLQAGITQAALGRELGLTFQHIQKYEKGVNRIGPGRLLKIAKLFNRPITAFYPIGGGDGALDINKIITL